jgi:hypothetical protein
VLPLVGAGYTDFGRLVLVLSISTAFVVAVVVTLAPIPRTLRTAALIAGPLADFGVFALLISKNGPCVGECYGNVALGAFAVLAFAAWLVGACSGYLLRKAITSSRRAPARQGRAPLH